MGEGLAFNIKMFGSTLTVNLYDNILENLESIMNIDYGDRLRLNIIIRNYLGVKDSTEDIYIEVKILNIEGESNNMGVTLNYYNGILYNVSYVGDSMENICDSLSITDNKCEIVRDRISIFYMLLCDAVYGREYNGMYKEYSESLLVRNNSHVIEHRYDIVDNNIIDNNEVMLASTSVFYKNNNSNELEHIVKKTNESVDIALIDFIRYLADILEKCSE